MGSHDSTDGGQQLLLGKRLLERGLITPDQLREALVERARLVATGDGKTAPLGGILVSKGFLTDAQLVDVLADNSSPRAAAAPATPPSAAGASVSLPDSAPTLPQDPSTTRLGKYALVRELGRGGMGVVYEALDTQLDRKVALKLLLVNPNLDPKDRKLEQDRFVQEAQLSAKLKHPNIVTVYEAGVLEGRQFLAMELVEGRPFGEWRQGANLKDQISVLRDVALAVHHAHEQGILHRDLKPRNILVGRNNQPFVTDFGLAKSMGKGASLSLTGSGAVVGTPAYMSPEQAQGLERIDWRTDIYSLGVILYEIMAGRPPFQGESPIEILMKVVKDPVVPPLQVAEDASALGLDKDIENVCLKAIAKKDRDRYVTAQAFADDLGKWIQGEQVKVVLPKVRRASRRRVRLGPVLLGTFLLLLGGGAGAWYYTGGSILTFLRPPVEEHLAKARQFMAAGDFQQAQVQFRIVLGFDPENAEARTGEADAGRRMEDKAARARKEEEERQAKIQKLIAETEDAERLAREKYDAEQVARSESERVRLAGERKTAEELARQLRARLDLLLGRGPGPRDPAGVDPPGGTWKNAVNLLALVDPVRNVVRGTWNWETARLVSDRERNARIEVPYEAPEEYDLRVQFSRRSGSDAVVVILGARGRQLAWVAGGTANTVSGFRTGNASFVPVPPQAAAGLRNDRTYELVFEVRRDAIRTLLDGKEAATLKTDFSDVSLASEWALRGVGAFGLGSHGSPAVFHRMELREHSGRGRKAEAQAGMVLRSTPVGFGRLKPGLIAEYFHGTNFESLAVRRHEVGLTYHWGESSSWGGGPQDGFSCRWTGYLQVTRPGRYVFQLKCDDGARLFLDDVQVIGGWSARPDAQRRGVVQLLEGFHRIRVEHFEVAHHAFLDVAWAEGVDIQPVSIPPRALFHNPADLAPFQAGVPQEAAGVLKGHQNSVTGLAWHPEGKLLASAGEDRRIKLWNVPGRRQDMADTMHPSGVLSVSMSPDGRILASGAWDSRVRLWLVAGGSEMNVLEGHTAFVQSVSFGPDGKRLASGSYDRTVRVWDVESGATVQVMSGHSGGVECVAWSPDGSLLASASMDHTLRIWDAESGESLHVLGGHTDFVESAAFSPDGKLLASAGWDGRVRLWDVTTGKEAGRLEGHTGEALCVAFSRDGRILATGGSDAMVRLWHVGTLAELRTLPGHVGRVMSLAFSKDGRILASGSFDSTVRLWDLGGP